MLDLLEIVLEPLGELIFELLVQLFARGFQEIWNWIVNRIV